jgi:molybdenum cofactor biosynthesis enzyme MoaA
MLKYKDVKRIHFELSSFCNARCPNCPRNVHGGYTIPGLKQVSITLDKFKKIITPDLLNQLEMFNFCGNYGDPMFCKDLPEILEYISVYNPKCYVEIHTNGGYHDISWWKKLAEKTKKLHKHNVIFSIDGLEDTNHIYRRDVDWKTLIDNATAFIENGGTAVWEFLIFNHNENQIDQAKFMSKELKFSKFVTKRAFGFQQHDSCSSTMKVIDKNGKFEYHIYEPSDKNNKNKFINSIKNDKSTYDLPKFVYESIAKHHIYDFDKIYKMKFHDTDNKTTCISCYSYNTNEIYIDSEGIVYPCCWLGHASQTSIFDFGNLQFINWIKQNVDILKINALNYSLEEILNSNYFDKISKTWELSNSQGKLQTCVLMCDKNENLLNLLYKDRE